MFLLLAPLSAELHAGEIPCPYTQAQISPGDILSLELATWFEGMGLGHVDFTVLDPQNEPVLQGAADRKESLELSAPEGFSLRGSTLLFDPLKDPTLAVQSSFTVIVGDDLDTEADAGLVQRCKVVFSQEAVCDFEKTVQAGANESVTVPLDLWFGAGGAKQVEVALADSKGAWKVWGHVERRGSTSIAYGSPSLSAAGHTLNVNAFNEPKLAGQKSFTIHVSDDLESDPRWNVIRSCEVSLK